MYSARQVTEQRQIHGELEMNININRNVSRDKLN